MAPGGKRGSDHASMIVSVPRRPTTQWSAAFVGRGARRRRGRRATVDDDPTATSSSTSYVGNFRRGGGGGGVDRRRTSEGTTAASAIAPSDDGDSLPILARVALVAIAQTCLSYAIASNLRFLGNASRAFAILFVVYGSSYLGSAIEGVGSENAATRQVLDPGRVPVSVMQSSGGGWMVSSSI